MAEPVGFEPTESFHPRSISSLSGLPEQSKAINRSATVPIIDIIDFWNGCQHFFTFNEFILSFFQISNGLGNCAHLHLSKSVSNPFTSINEFKFSTQKSGV